MNNSQQSSDVLSILKEHIRIGIQADEVEDNSLELLIEIAKLDEKYNELFNKMTADTEDIESIENQLIEINFREYFCVLTTISHYYHYFN